MSTQTLLETLYEVLHNAAKQLPAPATPHIPTSQILGGDEPSTSTQAVPPAPAADSAPEVLLAWSLGAVERIQEALRQGPHTPRRDSVSSGHSLHSRSRRDSAARILEEEETLKFSAETLMRADSINNKKVGEWMMDTYMDSQGTLAALYSQAHHDEAANEAAVAEKIRQRQRTKSLPNFDDRTLSEIGPLAKVIEETKLKMAAETEEVQEVMARHSLEKKRGAPVAISYATAAGAELATEPKELITPRIVVGDIVRLSARPAGFLPPGGTGSDTHSTHSGARTFDGDSRTRHLGSGQIKRTFSRSTSQERIGASGFGLSQMSATDTHIQSVLGGAVSLPGTASVPFAEIVQDDDDDDGIAHVHGTACRHGHDTVTEESEDDVAWVDDAESKVSKAAFRAYLDGRGAIEQGVLDQIEAILSKVDDWSIDLFKLSDLTNGAPLAMLGMRILRERGLIESLKLDSARMLNFLWKVEESYQPYPKVKYHNNIHAADVMHSTHVLLKNVAFYGAFSDLEIFAAIIAGAVHDCSHPGRTNAFLIKTSNNLAMLYNDISVLENFHLATAFRIMTEDPDCNILANFSSEEKLVVRKLMIDMVLSTDMAKHTKFLGEFKQLSKNLHGDPDATPDGDRPESVLAQLRNNYSDRTLVLCTIVHNADLGNPTKEWEICKEWTERLMEEFFEEGDEERAMGLPLGALNDRDAIAIPKCQIGFLSFVAMPLWKAWDDYLTAPHTQDKTIQLTHLEKNLGKWEALAKYDNCSSA